MKTISVLVLACVVLCSGSQAADGQCANGKCSIAKVSAAPVVAVGTVAKKSTIAVASSVRKVRFGLFRRARCR